MTLSSIPVTDTFIFNGKNVGVFMLHDFAGSPAHVRSLADYFAANGYSVKLPKLLGHGTSPEDLLTVSYDNLFKQAQDEFLPFYDEMDYTIILGFAAGGALAQQLAAKHEVSGLILINAFFSPPEKILQDAQKRFEQHEEYLETGTIDIKNERAQYFIYPKIPLALTLHLEQVSANLKNDAKKIVAPVLILQSVDDHVYSPRNADHMLNSFASKEKHLVMLQDSFHYAPIDYDQERILNQCIFFVRGLDPRRDD